MKFVLTDMAHGIRNEDRGVKEVLRSLLVKDMMYGVPSSRFVLKHMRSGSSGTGELVTCWP